MTEADWLSATDCDDLLAYLQSAAPPRRVALLVVAACRAVEHLLPAGPCRQLLDEYERHADGATDLAGYAAAHAAAEREWEGYWEAVRDGSDQMAQAGAGAAEFVIESTRPGQPHDYLTSLPGCGSILGLPPVNLDTERWPVAAVREAFETNLVRLIRDIFGNPFRPVPFADAWRTAVAVNLAATMYESRAFDRMPILADALQDAGCDDDRVLTHCRDPRQAHVRGCWVVDLVLGKG